MIANNPNRLVSSTVKSLIIVAIIGLLCVFAVTILMQLPQIHLPHPLPEIHQDIPIRQGHYQTDKRIFQASQAHTIMANPNNNCNFYSCGGSTEYILRICIGPTENGVIVHALQWLFYDVDAGIWNEGTTFVQRIPQKVDRYLINKNCKEIIQ